MPPAGRAKKTRPSPKVKPRAKSGASVLYEKSLITDQDLYLFNEGSHFRLYEKLGSHPGVVRGKKGFYFAVWAPNAKDVSVIGDFNDWNKTTHYLKPRGSSGIWEGFIPGVSSNTCYKYYIRSNQRSYQVDKTDPFGSYFETPPQTGTKTFHSDYQWADESWMKTRKARSSLDAPLSVYEVHLGSWMRVPENHHRPLSYRELAPKLADYVKNSGFTHVELLPVMEHPFYGSWGYQTTGYFAPTSRYGNPDDFRYLVDYLHQNEIGVILDWVPSHFPSDEHGLAYFDGTHLFEHSDPRQGFHPDWNSYIFNYGRREVVSFLISSAFCWLDQFHVDGIRVDAVASMLYLDYSRKEGEWIPNIHGGRENLEALNFLRRFNQEVYQSFPDVQTFAEESTAWPMVSRPTYLGGLGFGLKWDMGWMHDTLEFFEKDPVHRKFHHNEITFRMIYAFNENFIMPLSHDEVVHGKGSLLGKMPGDDWQKFANLKLLFGYQYAQPGKKLIFMGSEFGQWEEWNHEKSLDWNLLDYPSHQGVRRWISDLNQFYRQTPALYQIDFNAEGFEWIDASDSQNSVLTFLRKGVDANPPVLVVCNFTPVVRSNYRIGVPCSGHWVEKLNSDAKPYEGSGQGNLGSVETVPVPFHGRPQSLTLTLPPLGILLLQPEDE